MEYLIPRTILFLFFFLIGIWYVKYSVKKEQKKWIALKLIVILVLFRFLLDSNNGWIPAVLYLAAFSTFLFLIGIYVKDKWFQKKNISYK